jgi:RES domain-containing protein
MEALYLSEDLLTAVAEYEQELGIRPGTFCAYDLDMAGIVDLTDDRSRERVGVTHSDLMAPWKEIALVKDSEPPTWILAQRLLTQGCAGVRVPSAMLRDGVNIVLWRWGDVPERRVVAHDPLGDLPVDQGGWRH